jgi:hypothetical protein
MKAAMMIVPHQSNMKVSAPKAPPFAEYTFLVSPPLRVILPKKEDHLKKRMSAFVKHGRAVKELEISYCPGAVLHS